MTDRWGGVPCRDSNQQWYFPNSSLMTCSARCGRYTVAGMNYTATLNMVERDAQGNEFWSSGVSPMLDLPTVYVEVLQSGSERGVATFYESNTYGNDVSQKSCSFPSPFISEIRNNYPLWRLFICFFFTRSLACCFEKMFSFKRGWYVFWVRFINKWIIITRLKALCHKSYNSHMT